MTSEKAVFVRHELNERAAFARLPLFPPRAADDLTAFFSRREKTSFYTVITDDEDIR